MTNNQLIQHLSNEVFHDLEKGLESAESLEEELFWEGQIEALERHIAFLRTEETYKLA